MTETTATLLWCDKCHAPIAEARLAIQMAREEDLPFRILPPLETAG